MLKAMWKCCEATGVAQSASPSGQSPQASAAAQPLPPVGGLARALSAASLTMAAATSAGESVGPDNESVVRRASSASIVAPPLRPPVLARSVSRELNLDVHFPPAGDQGTAGGVSARQQQLLRAVADVLPAALVVHGHQARQIVDLAVWMGNQLAAAASSTPSSAQAVTPAPPGPSSPASSGRTSAASGCLEQLVLGQASDGAQAGSPEGLATMTLRVLRGALRTIAEHPSGGTYAALRATGAAQTELDGYYLEPAACGVCGPALSPATFRRVKIDELRAEASDRVFYLLEGGPLEVSRTQVGPKPKPQDSPE